MTSKVSIVIPLYKISERFYQCMESLKEHSEDVEVIVIRSGGSFAENCNRGIRATNSEYVCLLNDDTIVTKGWLEPMVRLLDDKPNAGAVSPMMLFPDGHIQFGGMIFHDNYRGGHLHWHRWQGDPCLMRTPHEFQATTFGCVLLRREALRDVEITMTRGTEWKESWNAYLDESYKIGGVEDIDWCFKARLKEWEIWYQPESRIFHHENATFRILDQQKRLETAKQSLNLYYARWKKYFENGTFKVDDKDYYGGLDNYAEGKHTHTDTG